jgi:hypothetical protein
MAAQDELVAQDTELAKDERFDGRSVSSEVVQEVPSKLAVKAYVVLFE